MGGERAEGKRCKRGDGKIIKKGRPAGWARSQGGREQGAGMPAQVPNPAEHQRRGKSWKHADAKGWQHPLLKGWQHPPKVVAAPP